jgi:hypothetical protein
MLKHMLMCSVFTMELKVTLVNKVFADVAMLLSQGQQGLYSWWN